VLSDDEIEEIFKKIDVNNNGTIEYTEFISAAMEAEKLLSKHKMARAFKFFDQDGSG
jgi:calcium-dependent protein kinase